MGNKQSVYNIIFYVNMYKCKGKYLPSQYHRFCENIENFLHEFFFKKSRNIHVMQLIWSHLGFFFIKKPNLTHNKL